MLALHAPHVDKLELDPDNLSESLEEEEFMKVLGNVTFSAFMLLVWFVVSAFKFFSFFFSLLVYWTYVSSCDFLGTRPSLPDIPLTEDYLPVLEIFYACTELEPAKRPTAGQIVQILENMADEKDNTKGKEIVF